MSYYTHPDTQDTISSALIWIIDSRSASKSSYSYLTLRHFSTGPRFYFIYVYVLQIRSAPLRFHRLLAPNNSLSDFTASYLLARYR